MSMRMDAIDHGTEAVGGGPRVEALFRLLGALEAGHPDLYGHGEAVAGHCVAVAKQIGLGPEQVGAIALAGKLHDVGKAGIDRSVLLKPAPLTPAQWAEICLHPQIGANLSVACGLGPVAEWIYAHHERPDGAGYPRGLGADEIPLEAKILAAADAYDAMRTDRVYRPALTDEQAAVELRGAAGRQFDGAVVEALLATA
jgi:HD-GYP domain-containing protein (c-di-GMP phosphodiesterase class II)